MTYIELSRTRRIDWPRMAENLRALGMTWTEIAGALEIDRTAMRNWAEPEAVGEPAFWTGSAMLRLWCDRTGLRWVDAPVRVVTPSVSEILRTS